MTIIDKTFMIASAALKHSPITQSKLKLIPNFISQKEEEQILNESEKKLKRLKYQRDHWDDAIVGYREFESANWSEQTLAVIERVKREAHFSNSPRQLVHVLDIDAAGFIKPHIDSNRYDKNKDAKREKGLKKAHFIQITLN